MISFYSVFNNREECFILTQDFFHGECRVIEAILFSPTRFFDLFRFHDLSRFLFADSNFSYVYRPCASMPHLLNNLLFSPTRISSSRFFRSFPISSPSSSSPPSLLSLNHFIRI